MAADGAARVQSEPLVDTGGMEHMIARAKTGSKKDRVAADGTRLIGRANVGLCALPKLFGSRNDGHRVHKIAKDIA